MLHNIFTINQHLRGTLVAQSLSQLQLSWKLTLLRFQSDLKSGPSTSSRDHSF